MTTKPDSKNILLKITAALSYCSDLLNYPDIRTIHKIDSLKELSADFNDYQLATAYQKQDLSYKPEKLAEIETEYTGLFVTGIDGVKCVPYASWWIEGKLMGEATIKIEKFYEYCGFKLDPEIIKGPPDHIALEIGFLTRLLEEKMPLEAVNMINGHLGWITRFTKCVHQNGKLSLYPFVTQLTANIIAYLKEEESWHKQM